MTPGVKLSVTMSAHWTSSLAISRPRGSAMFSVMPCLLLLKSLKRPPRSRSAILSLNGDVFLKVSGRPGHSTLTTVAP